MRKKLLCTVILFVCAFLVITSQHALAINDYNFRPDFVKDRVAAEEFGERKAGDFVERLTPREQEIFRDETRYNLSGLRSMHLNLDTYLDLSDRYKEDIEEWDSLFRKGERSTGQQFIYLYLKPEFFGYKEGQWDNGLQISQGALMDLANNFQYMNHSGYIIGDLVSNNINIDYGERLIIRLRTPVGTRQIYTGNSRVILERDQAIEVFNWRIITEKGRQVMLFEADLVPKERFLRNIEIETQRSNTQLMALLKEANGGIDVNIKDPISLDLASVRSQTTIHELREIISYMGEVLPPVILKDLFVKHALRVIYYDRALVDNESLNGLYTDKKIEFYNQKDFNSIKTRTMIHEFGHAVDHLILSNLSHTTRFRDLFESESQNLTAETSDIVNGRPYGTRNQHEFFAEVFSAIYSTDVRRSQLMRAQVPNSYRFIEDRINNYIRYGDVFLK